ncbi:MAG: MBL fold metallo-hydrolase [Clostridia bacterium]|nr:MBL fold metallo-hydrolase [Clostridia bacterium]
MTELSIQTVVGGPVEVNTYVVSPVDGDQCILIDPGADAADIKKAIGDRKVAAVLLTHAHFDHMCSAQPWLDAGAKLYVHQADAPALADPAMNLATMIRMNLVLPLADALLSEGDVVKEAGLELTVLHTPGHTPGCVCYQYGDILFSGDTLFYKSYGRIDLPGGNCREMYTSLMRLMQLDGETSVYPGHGIRTKIAWERGAYR